MVGAAGPAVFTQDQTRPIQRARENPGRLHARALCGFYFHASPLLEQRSRSKRSDQRHRQHGRQKRCTGLPGL